MCNATVTFYKYIFSESRKKPEETKKKKIMKRKLLIYTKNKYIFIYELCPKSIEYEVVFSKTEMNNEWNVFSKIHPHSIQRIYSRVFSISQKTSDASDRSSFLYCLLGLQIL